MVSSICLFLTLSCHAGLAPRYPFRLEENAGATSLGNGPLRPRGVRSIPRYRAELHDPHGPPLCNGSWERHKTRGHQKVHRPIGAPIRDLNLQGLLSPAQGRIVRDGPARPGAAGWRPFSGLPERQLEQHLDRQAELDRCVREDRRSPRSSLMRRVPSHLLVEPDQQRAALPERGVVTRPVRRAGSGRVRASSSIPSKRMDSRCESSPVRVVQQRRPSGVTLVVPTATIVGKSAAPLRRIA